MISPSLTLKAKKTVHLAAQFTLRLGTASAGRSIDFTVQAKKKKKK